MEYITLRGKKIYVDQHGILNLSRMGIKDIAEIDGLNHLNILRVLNLGHNNINEIKGMGYLRDPFGLKKAYIDSNRTSEIKELGNQKKVMKFVNLEELDLSYNEIHEIEGLENLTELRSLWLNSNEIREIKGLETLTKLKFLNLDNNNISKIEDLDNLVALKELNLENNKIHEIKGLDTLIELKSLSLLHNKIRGLKNYGTQHGYAAIPRIRGLRNLVNLETLYLTGSMPDGRREDLCRNFILKTYSASETIWWGLKHMIVNIYIPILIMLTFISIMFFLGIDPLSLMRNILFWIVLGVCFFFIAIYLVFMYKHKDIPRALPSRIFLNRITHKLATIGFVGDIMPTGPYDIRFSQRVRNFFFNCELIVGNLEGIMVEEPSYEKIGRRISTQRHALTIMNLLLSLGKPSKDWLLCVSNNHSGDLGIDGFLEMLRILKGRNFNFFGNEDNPTFPYSPAGFIINFVAGTMWSNYRKCRFVSRFGCASKYHDDNAFNILFPHWHYENEPYVRPLMGEKSRNFIRFGKYKRDKEIEKFYSNPKSNSFQSGLNEWDFIFGHHSHTPQAIEIITQKIISKAIAYSGGNFTSGKGRRKHRKGIIAKITLGNRLENPNRIVVAELEWRYTYNF